MEKNLGKIEKLLQSVMLHYDNHKDGYHEVFFACLCICAWSLYMQAPQSEDSEKDLGDLWKIRLSA